jgi:phosphonate transport system permease protein
MTTSAPSSHNNSRLKLSFWLATSGFIALFFADIDVHQASPGRELLRMAQGLLSPNFWSYPEIAGSALNTLAFALQGMALASAAGFILALFYRHPLVRGFCAFIRAIHELFWALIFIQLFGLSPLTGLLAIAIPYAGTLAKIYGELFEETEAAPRNNLLHSGGLSAFFYTTLPLAWRPLLQYTSYRFECAIRSSIVLGFVGLPTLGYHLETALGNGQYQDAAALLYVLLAIVASLRWWLKKALLPIYLIAAVVYLPPTAHIVWSNIARFFSEDIIPAPLRGKSNVDFPALADWLAMLWQQQILPGAGSTIVLSQIALLLTALLSLAWFPLNSRQFFNPLKRSLGDGFLIIARTLPEYLLTFIGLLLLGPSMLPAILALGIHNGAIIAHLLGRHSGELQLRDDACGGLNRYGYEVLPRVYRQFLAFLLYRWEVIMRETAILGMLGIGTLGFYIDSAFEEFRFDRAMLLILCAALLNILADILARYCRQRLHLRSSPETL